MQSTFKIYKDTVRLCKNKNELGYIWDCNKSDRGASINQSKKMSEGIANELKVINLH